MDRRQSISEVVLWVSAGVIGLLPTVIALDFGGILPWTQYVAALVLFAAGLAAFAARLALIGCPKEIRQGWLAFAPTLFVICLAGYGYLQTISIPIGIVQSISPASGLVYLNWLGPLFESADHSSIPISIAPFDSKHVIAMLAVISVLAATASTVFIGRDRGRWLFIALCIFGLSIALVGIGRELASDWRLWSFQEGGEGAPFGAFPNRNNAAFGMNLGIAAGLGILCWQWRVLDLGSGGNRGRAIPSRLKDPLVIVSVVPLVITAIAVLGCGSRGGALSLLCAGVTTFLVFQRLEGRTTGWLAAAITLCVIFGYVAQSQQRVGTVVKVNEGNTVEPVSRVREDARLLNWPDGFRAGVKHLPAGSGLGTYGYAYLPWQETSPWRWCAHADNLWLEAFVELGLPGCGLIAAAMVMIGHSLRRLATSVDPLDHAFCVSGTFFAVSTLISQVFDFGLIIPANLIGATLMFSTIVGRAALVETVGKKQTKLVLHRANTRWWKSSLFLTRRLPGIAVSSLVLIVSIPAIEFLRRDSVADSMAKSLAVLVDLNGSDVNLMSKRIDDVSQFSNVHPHPDLLDQLTLAEFQVGRMKELEQRGISLLSTTDQAVMSGATSLADRRLSWRSSQPDLGAGVTSKGRPVPQLPVLQQSNYLAANLLAERHLNQRPLSLEGRRNLIGLEFVHQSAETTARALDQCSRLFRNNPELQFKFGTIAADSGDYTAAAEYWNRAISLRAQMRRRVLERAARYAMFPFRTLPDHSNSNKRS